MIFVTMVYVICFLSFSSHSWNFHSYGDVSITGEGLQILTYARHSCPLNSEGSLACHTYCDTAHPFIMVISWTRDTQTCNRAFSGGAVTICFYDLGLSRMGFEHPNFRMRSERSNRLRDRRGPWRLIPLVKNMRKSTIRECISCFSIFVTYDHWFEIYSAFKQLILSKWFSLRNWIEKLYCNVCRISVIIHIDFIELWI